MASDPTVPRSRRALLTAAAGGAAAFAVTATIPLTAAAADGDPMLVGTDHDGTQETSLVVTSPALDPQAAFRGHNVGADAAGVIGSAGDETDIDEDTPFSGVYGWSQADPVDAGGVWGSSPDPASSEPAPSECWGWDLRVVGLAIPAASVYASVDATGVASRSMAVCSADPAGRRSQRQILLKKTLAGVDFEHASSFRHSNRSDATSGR